MKATLFPTLALLVVLLLTTTGTIASPTRGGHRDDKPPVRPELKAYIEQNVLPVVRQQRQKLEAQLTTVDKAQLATYRAQLQEVRQRRQARRQSFRAGQPTLQPAESSSPRPALTEAQQQQLEQLRAETRSIILKVSKMAQRYGSNIAQLTQEIKPQQEKWVADMQALLAKDTIPELLKFNRFRHGLHHPFGPARYLRPVAFLLFDPGVPAATAVPGLSGTSLYPNPVVATGQLNYEVTKAGAVTVELLDGRGTILRTVAQEPKQEKGSHTLQVNLTDLPSGTYYYKITTRAGSETKRFVKE